MKEPFNAPLSKEELSEAVPSAYRTADFEFVAFALANETPQVQVVQIIPYDDPKKAGYKSRQFVFVLVGKGEEEDWYQKLEDLAYDYINGRTMIEPMRMGAKRKLLRALMLNHPSAHGARDKRSK